MSHSFTLPRTSRRGFLRGLGGVVALPFLEGMGAPSAAPAVNRLAFVYHPNGANMEAWAAKGGTLDALSGVRDRVTVIAGLDHEKAAGNGDGAGDHARSTATFLTGVQVKKTAGSDFRGGVSVDQIAAEAIGRESRLPSLELSCDSERRAGICDSGYSCVYQYNLSWKSPTMPMASEVNPRLVFERLFESPNPKETERARATRMARRASLLDFVKEDAKQLQKRLGGGDRAKMDEYLTSLREVERRIEVAEDLAQASPEMVAPTGIPATHREHVRVMYDLLALAFETDSTRVATLMLSHDGSHQSFPEIGISEGHHDLSHHQNNQEKLAKIAKIDRFYVEEFARYLEKLRGIREGDSNVLENTMIVYGSSISDGNLHRHDDLPVLLAGGGAGTLRGGQNLQLGGSVPMTNLYLSLLDRLGVEAERVGDSTGRLEGI